MSKVTLGFKLWGWPRFGVGRMRFTFTESGNYYTMWMVFLTGKLAFGVHLGGHKGK
jgi:hypothetical protein